MSSIQSSDVTHHEGPELFTPTPQIEMDIPFEKIAPWFQRKWIHHLLMVLLIYGALSAIFVPRIASSQLPRWIHAWTGVHLSIDSASYSPYALRISLQGVKLGPTTAMDLFRAERVQIDLGVIRSVFHRALAFDALDLSHPAITIRPDREHGNNLMALSDAWTAHQPTEDPNPSSSTNLIVAMFRVTGGVLDAVLQEGRSPLQFSDISVDLRNLHSANPREAVNFSFSARENGLTVMAAEGQWSSPSVPSLVRLKVEDLDLSRLETQFPLSGFRGKLSGVLNIEAHVAAKEDSLTDLVITLPRAEIRELAILPAGETVPILEVSAIELRESLIDLAAHRLDMGDLSIRQATLTSTIETGGTPSWATLLPVNQEDGPPVDPSPSVPWQFGVKKLTITDLAMVPLGTGRADETYPGVRIGVIRTNGLTVNTDSREIRLEHFSIDDSRVLLGFSPEGISPFKEFTPPPTHDPSAESHNVAPPKPWSYHLGESEGNHVSLGVIQNGEPRGHPFAFNALHFETGALDSRLSGKTPFSGRAEISSGGTMSFTGGVDLAGKTTETELNFTKVGLSPLTPFLTPHVNIDRFDGLLSSQLSLKGHAEEGGLTGNIEGTIQLSDLVMTQSPGERKLLSWRDLNVSGFRASLNPMDIAVDEIRVLGPDAVIAIRQDKRSNLTDLMNPTPTVVTTAHSPATKEQKKAPASLSDVHVRRILVEGGSLSYSDESLIIPFTTQILDLKGALSGWTLDPSGKSLIDLHGRIAPYGEAEIRGELRPLNPQSLLNVELHFENVVLASLTPYSATFAGRRLEDGKLDLNARYQLENQQLSSENRILLKHLRLGEKVESPKAVPLPLDLAVALLSDSEGNIDLSLPIDGRTDAPDFDYGAIILNAIQNLIKKAVLSPITALSSALGLQNGEDLDSINFDLGSDLLTPPEKEKVGMLAKALLLKPELKLILQGAYAQDADLDALRSRWLRKEVGHRLGETSKSNEEPDPVNPTEPSTQRVLEEIATEFRVMDRAVARYSSEKGHLPDHVGVMGRMVGRSSKTPDFYELLLPMIEQSVPMGEQDLTVLARHRVDAVISALKPLVRPLDMGRIRMGDTHSVDSEDQHHIHMPLSMELN